MDNFGTYFILLTQMQWSVTKSSQLLAASQFCTPNYQSICKHFPRKWILDFHFFLLQKGYRQALKEDSYCAADSFWYLLTYINENLHDHHCSPTELDWVVMILEFQSMEIVHTTLKQYVKYHNLIATLFNDI